MAIVKNNLKEIIKQKRFSQKYIADKAGIAEQTLSNCIHNRFDISLKIALQIAKVLDVDVGEIFSLEDDELDESESDDITDLTTNNDIKE